MFYLIIRTHSEKVLLNVKYMADHHGNDATPNLLGYIRLIIDLEALCVITFANDYSTIYDK